MACVIHIEAGDVNEMRRMLREVLMDVVAPRAAMLPQPAENVTTLTQAQVLHPDDDQDGDADADQEEDEDNAPKTPANPPAQRKPRRSSAEVKAAKAAEKEAAKAETEKALTPSPAEKEAPKTEAPQQPSVANEASPAHKALRGKFEELMKKGKEPAWIKENLIVAFGVKTVGEMSSEQVAEANAVADKELAGDQADVFA